MSLEKTDLTRLIIERAHSAFVSMDSDGRIMEWNPSAERVFGWGRDEVLGRAVADVVMPERYREAHDRGLKRFLSTGDGPVLNTTIEIEGQRRDGAEFPVALTISSIEADGEWTFHAFIQDISERRAAEVERERHAAELAEANERLAAADQLKDQFLAMASHEMRTPLAAIAGFAETMQDMWEQLEDPRKQEFVSIISAQTRRLQRLVDDLLTLARIESGAMEPHLEALDVADVVQQTVHQLGASGVEVRCPTELTAIADRDHLQQILTNYVGNAVKYGSDPIEVTGVAVDEGVEIRVCDSGTGVPAEFVPHLFERFSRASSSAGAVAGTGLGLSITKGLAIAQGGDAWYEPAESGGACFVLRLRFAS